MPIDEREVDLPLLRGLVSRRAALAGLGLGVTAMLAGCDHKRKERRRWRRSRDMSDTERVVNWSNWPDYIDVGDDGLIASDARPVHQADRYHGALHRGLLRQRGVLHQGQPAACRRAGHRPRHVVRHRLDGGQADPARLRPALDKSNMPNSHALSPSLVNVEFDRGRKYSIPWQSGFTGIGYNSKVDRRGGRADRQPAVHRSQAQGQGDVADRHAGHRRADDAGHGDRPGEVHRRGFRSGHGTADAR